MCKNKMNKKMAFWPAVRMVGKGDNHSIVTMRAKPKKWRLTTNIIALAAVVTRKTPLHDYFVVVVVFIWFCFVFMRLQ